MRRRLLGRLVAAVAGVALATGFLTVAAVPARAATFAVSITASASTVTVGARVTFKGTVSPRPSSRTLYLQRRYVGSTGWTTVKKFYATSTGRYSVATGFGNDRDRYYRVYKPKTSTRRAGYSSAVQVVVNPPATGDPATLTSITPGTQPLSGGQPVTIAGTGLAGTTRVTVTPQVPGSQTKDGSGILPELPAAFELVDAGTLQVTPPASLGGVNLVKVYTPTATLTGAIGYARAATDPSDFEQQVLDQVNVRRSTEQVCRGVTMPPVGPLDRDGELADLARSHARDLAARFDGAYGGALAHETFGLKSFAGRFELAGYGTGGYGEDLALTPKSYTAAQVVTLWMQSTAGHCESVMNPRWTRAGLGVADGTGTRAGYVFTNLDLRY